MIPNISTNNSAKAAFTLIEFLTVLFVFAVLIILIVSGLEFFGRQTSLDEQSQMVIEVLRLAQNQTVASEQNQQYGLHFENDEVILFRGTSYNPGDPNNQTYILDREVAISEINLNPASTTAEVVFEKISGATSNDGSVRLSLLDDPTKSQLIYIEPSGQISLLAAPVPANGRQTDSRHIHISFTRNIDTTTEQIFLTFNGAALPQETIDIASNLSAGQIDWSGTVSIGGEDQVIRIHTHELNNPDTIFCIHRDQRQSTKSLKIDIESDNLINYAADGILTDGTSIWASNPEIQ